MKCIFIFFEETKMIYIHIKHNVSLAQGLPNKNEMYYPNQISPSNTKGEQEK